MLLYARYEAMITFVIDEIHASYSDGRQIIYAACAYAAYLRLLRCH